MRLLRVLLFIIPALCLGSCATSNDDPNPPITPSERMSLQNECVQIAGNRERERCLENAAFAEKH